MNLGLILHDSNLVNNSRFIGDRMRLSPDDVLCCPPPLFHCFGLVLGLLAIVTHGGKIVYPAEVFDIPSTLRAISDESCTAVHGVPAMFDSLFQAELPPGFNCEKLRTGIIAGAPVPRYLMELLVNRFGMTEFTSSYGLTEASPTCFNAFTDDAMHRRLTTVGTLMPHANAKIVDREGNVVPVGERGELCMAGYQLQAGYWNNSEKTNEVMVRDAAGVLWLHTGDEAVFDEHGYCTITGRFKDIIIRGKFVVLFSSSSACVFHVFLEFDSRHIHTRACIRKNRRKTKDHEETKQGTDTHSQAAKTSTLSKSKNVSWLTPPSRAPSSSA